MSGGSSAQPANLFGKYHKLMYAEACRVAGDAFLAQDCVQEALIRALKACRAGTRVDCDAAWILKIVRNTAHLLKSRQDRAMALAQEWADAVGPRREQASPREIASRREEAARIEDAVGELPQKLRTAFVMWAKEGRTYREIAYRTGVSKSCAVLRVRTAYYRIASRLANLDPP